MSSLVPPFSSSAPSSSFSSSRPDGSFRIAIMGAPAVGKTAMIYQFIHNGFLKGYWSTVQERYLTDMDINGKCVSLDIFDTPGSYCFSNVRQLAITNADAFVLVYSIFDETSLEMLAKLRGQIMKLKPRGTPIIVVGNKTDLIEETRFISKDKVERLVTMGWEHNYIETSTKDNESIKTIFQEVISQLQASTPDRRGMTTPAHLFRALMRRLSLRRSNTVK